MPDAMGPGLEQIHQLVVGCEPGAQCPQGRRGLGRARMPSEEGRAGGVPGFPDGRFVDGLDEAAKGLAAGTISRGRAIKLGAAALLSSLGLFSLFEGEAGAQQAAVRGACENKPAISNNKCPLHSQSRCGACPSCTCARTVGGRKRCLDFARVECSSRDECDSARDCPGNGVCVQVGRCCGHPEHPKRNLCVPPCPTDPDNCPPAP